MTSLLSEGRWGLTPHQEQMLRELVAEQAKVPAPDEIPDQVEFVSPSVLKQQVRELSARVERLEHQIMILTRNESYNPRQPSVAPGQIWNTVSQTNNLSNQTNAISNSNTAALQLAQQELKNYTRKYGL